MCLEELQYKYSKDSVVQLDWLPKCHMKTGNEPSTAKDFSGQKKVIMTYDSALATISRHMIQAWRVSILLHFGSRGNPMSFRGEKDST
jgi:hypothetical protein